MLPIYLRSLAFDDTRVVYTSFIILGLGSYYVYKKILPLFLRDRKQIWKKIPFIKKK
jgi:hypothetical protein